MKEDEIDLSSLCPYATYKGQCSSAICVIANNGTGRAKVSQKWVDRETRRDSHVPIRFAPAMIGPDSLGRALKKWT